VTTAIAPTPVATTHRAVVMPASTGGTPETLSTASGTLRRETYVERHAISGLAETLDYRPKAVRRAFADGERAWRELTAGS